MYVWYLYLELYKIEIEGVKNDLVSHILGYL